MLVFRPPIDDSRPVRKCTLSNVYHTFVSEHSCFVHVHVYTCTCTYIQVNQKFLELKRDRHIGIVEKAQETSLDSSYYA